MLLTHNNKTIIFEYCNLLEKVKLKGINNDFNKYYKIEYLEPQYEQKLTSDSLKLFPNLTKINIWNTNITGKFNDNYIPKFLKKKYILDIDNLNIDELKMFFDMLIKFCYTTTDIKYVLYKSSFFTKKDKNKKETPKYIPKNQNDVNYEFVYNKNIKLSDFKDCFASFGNDKNKKTEFNIFKNLLKTFKYDINNVFIKSKRDITLFNISGINKDKRGSDLYKCDVLLPFYDTLTIVPKNNLISINELYTSFYKIKSNKFDKWYELYGCISQMIVQSYIYLEIEYDHGS